MSIDTSLGRRASSTGFASPFDFVHRVEIATAQRSELFDIEPDSIGSVGPGELVPIRKQRNHVGAPNFSGLHFHASLRRHVWFESRLEQQFVELTECDDSIVDVVAQPLKLHWVEADLRTHIPDYLVVHRDGRVRVVNARPSERVAKSERVFALLETFAESVGIEAEVFTGLSADEAEALSFLHRYRLAGGCLDRPEFRESLTPRWVYDQDDSSLVRDMWIAVANGDLSAETVGLPTDDCILTTRSER